MRSNWLQHRNTCCWSYCAEAAKTPLYTANVREETKTLKYFQAYKQLNNIHFEPIVVESGGELGERVQEIFKKICNLITQATGQSGSSIAYFWKSRLLLSLWQKSRTLIHSNGQWHTTNPRIQIVYQSISRTVMTTILKKQGGWCTAVDLNTRREEEGPKTTITGQMTIYY